MTSQMRIPVLKLYCYYTVTTTTTTTTAAAAAAATLGVLIKARCTFSIYYFCSEVFELWLIFELFFYCFHVMAGLHLGLSAILIRRLIISQIL
jgi:hypothetical protein